MRTAHAAIFMLLLAPCGLGREVVAFAQAANPSTVLTSARKRIEESDFKANGRLVHITGSGERTSYKFTIKAHWFPDGLRVLCEIINPTAGRSLLFLHMTVSGRLSIEELKADSKTAKPVPFERWNEPLLGTDLSFEDMLEGQFFWKGQEMLPAANYGARSCFVIHSTPSGEDRSYYGSVTSWIDRTIFYPVHVVKKSRDGQQEKDFNYEGLRQTSGVWSASQVEVKVPGKSGSSLMIIDGGSPKVGLTLHDFDPGQPQSHGKE